MNTLRWPWLVLALLAPLPVLNGCSGGPKDPAAGLVGGTIDQESAEAKWMVHMREEEKLARDVYALHGADPTFANITSAEQQHFDRMGALLAAYGLQDPAAGRPADSYSDPSLQALHDALVAKAAGGEAAALAVGAEIEEVDIVDLDTAIAATPLADAKNVYEQLQRGSRNHLRAFHARLSAVGVTYVPKHLDAARYAAIVAAPTEKGP